MNAVPFVAEFEIRKHEFADTKFFIEGYVSTTDYDLQGHKITPDAIKGSRDDLMKNSTMLLNHDPNRPIGKVVATKFSSHGLWVKAEISATELDVRQKIKEGILNKFSIRGKVIEAGNEVDPSTKTVAKIIRKMYLTECSLVSCPANPEAEVVDWQETEKSLLGSIVKALSGGHAMTILPEEVKVQKGFPMPDELAEQWKSHISGIQLSEGDDEKINQAWSDFCHQYGYPSPYPYPYPSDANGYPYPKPKTPAANGAMKRIADLAAALIRDEKSSERKKMLEEIKGLAEAKNGMKKSEDPAPAPVVEKPADAPAPAAAVAEVAPAKVEEKPVDPLSDPKVQAAIDAKVAEKLAEEKKKLEAAQPAPQRKGVIDVQNKAAIKFEDAPPMNRLRVATARLFESEHLLHR